MIGTGTEKGKCKVCGENTGDYVNNNDNKTFCCFEHIYRLKENKKTDSEERTPLNKIR